MFWYAKPEAEPTLLENPWRQTKGEWNDKYCGEIIQELKEFEVGDKITKAQCLLLGPVISGKSSFVNSVISICKKRYSNSAYTAGRRWTSVTREYFSFDCEDEIGKKFCLCDTAGMMEKEEHGFNVENIVFLIEGNVEDGYKFNPTNTIEENDFHFRKNPMLADKIHCAVFVLPATAIDRLSEMYMEKFRILQEKLVKKDIPRVLLLTNCDLFCDEVKQNKRNLYRSIKVEKVATKAAETLSIPLSNIHPIVNHGGGEVYLDPATSIPILLALRQMIHFANDFIEKYTKKEKMENARRNKRENVTNMMMENTTNK
ncbi:interferon-induced protein 44-like [Mercenaria mercenaria]|uniref:interferon-induced protein 44-like n=1 Tax=Mercenaria mercenaria TaxID=6596 RepID=UPI00234EB722|nr:interferon-induced protein 44-like [Mercenaria mercenaria]